MDITHISDELYGLPPQAFTPARDEYVAQARANGDREAARALGALKRPTLGAWLVNLVALRRPEAVRGLLDVAAAIRAATNATQLRELSQRRREEIDSALDAARDLAVEAGGGEPTRAALAEAESTLAAAMADEQAARLVVAGRVVKALSYGGFGELGGLGGEVVAARPAPRKLPARPVGKADTGDGGEAQAQAHAQAQARAQQRVDAAQQALADAQAQQDAAQRELDEIAGQLEQLRLRQQQAEQSLRAARQARLSAQRDLESAQRRLARTG